MDSDPKFIAAHKRMEKRTNGITAAIVINPQNPQRFGRIVIYHSRTGTRCSAITWLPNEPAATDWLRHHRHADGWGYDKASAAMSGARFWNLKAGALDRLKDDGHSWRHQLEDAGYIVAEAC